MFSFEGITLLSEKIVGNIPNEVGSYLEDINHIKSEKSIRISTIVTK